MANQGKRAAIIYPKEQSYLDQLGENILLAMKRRKLTQSVVSSRTGISKPTLRKIVRGDSTVSIGHYLRVLAVLGLGQDLAAVAKDDALGAKLQDIELLKSTSFSKVIKKLPTQDQQEPFKTTSSHSKSASAKSRLLGYSAFLLLQRISRNPGSEVIMSARKSILVYAGWVNDDSNLIGTLHADPIRGSEHFSFEYSHKWLKRSDDVPTMLDPDLQLFDGVQHAQDGKNFRVFLDSCPDTWGRLLMKRREAVEAKRQGRQPKALSDSDYLLGVCDQSRMGALRFKLEHDGPFLDSDTQRAAPPMAKLRELEHASSVVENDFDDSDPDTLKWLSMLMAPGTSLGGARPKASVVDDQGHLWIAKFPSGHDQVDVGAWEYLAYKLALDAKITMSECRIESLLRAIIRF